MQPGEALDMAFVDCRLRPGNPRLARRRRVAGSGSGDRLRQEGRVVAGVGGEIQLGMGAVIAEVGILPAELAGEFPGIGVDQQFGGIEAVAFVWRVGSVDPVAIARSRRQAGDKTVPDAVAVLRQRQPRGLPAAGTVEQAQLDRLGVGRIQREPGAFAIAARPEPIRVAGFDAFAAPAAGFHRSPECSRNTVASGGRRSTSECGWPSQGSASLRAPPPLPWPPPPYSRASVLRHSR